ncbi:glutamine--fructose-6-phosphate transaminase (isomerizing) [Burkholderia singularis]|uniref:Glutamine--fructose-6-phosphate aminotransferase [isomerizing] n=1 Tax=Burkholderia singularis TaxID=1503053 RepID=A0A238H6X4_9BURK|nr:glutamine--fructose-6-phosphate transaminase (isomerizing) [Burkholderia singularis]SMG01004.1 Glucosamine--fructose-6-phosphate aminotransferase [isomerizing] [Burkholderia singularis]
MCGIVGAVAQRNIVPVLIEGLRRLEYRGYDSCGVAVLEAGAGAPTPGAPTPGAPKRARSVERVADLDAQVRESRLEGVTGIAHTRWATHGAPITQNAHPIFSSNALALVHNGIIENFEPLRDALRAKGYEFVSQTDTEVVAHLIHSLYQGNLFDAVQQAVRQLHGAYAIAVIHRDEPHTVVGARQGSPLVVGFGERENFLASDALALAGSTDRFTFLEEGDVCELTLDGVRIADRDGARAERDVRVVAAYGGAVELGPYRHFMQKEIFEQPRAISDTIPQTDAFGPSLFGEHAAGVFADIDSLLILACGTSYYSGVTAKYWLESIAKIPTQVEIASEYRYRESVPNPRALVVVISQSGETADTLAALKHAQALGHSHTLAICNVATSAMVRQTGLQFLTHAGTEIGVASTKAFTTQLVALFVLAATLGKLRGHVDAAREADYLKQLRHLPAALNSVLALEPQIIAWSEEFARKENALFLGRGLHYPISLEGALKLKEISYIHAEAYPAGELKHGPLALVTEAMPVVTVAPNDTLLEKLKSNMQEVRARGGELYVFADADTHIVNGEGLHVIRMPEHYGLLSPILHVVPLQLLAYHTACARGTDVDKPRNLAKSVTVE